MKAARVTSWRRFSSWQFLFFLPPPAVPPGSPVPDPKSMVEGIHGGFSLILS